MNKLFWGIDICASWIEIFFSCFFVMNRFQIEKTDRRNWSTLLATTMAILVFLFNRFELFSFVHTVIFLGLEIWAIYRYVQKKLAKILFYVIFTIVLIGICDGFSILVVEMLGNYQTDEWFTQVGIMRMIATIISKMLYIVFIMIADMFVREASVVKRWYIVVCVLIEIALMSGLYLVVVGTHSPYKIGIFLGIVCVFLFGNIMFRYLFQRQERHMNVELLRLRNEMLEKSLKDTEELYGFWRKAVHDYKHKILVINNYVEENRIEELKHFLAEEQKYISREMFYQRTGNHVVDTVLNVKKQQALELGIVFTFSAYLPEKMGIQDIHLATIVGNVVDNAIQAKSIIKQPWVEVKMEMNNNVLLLKVDNGYIGEEIDFSKSIKSECYFHGIGLRSVRDILKEYDGYMQLKQLEDKVRCVITVPIASIEL